MVFTFTPKVPRIQKKQLAEGIFHPTATETTSYLIGIWRVWPESSTSGHGSSRWRRYGGAGCDGRSGGSWWRRYEGARRGAWLGSSRPRRYEGAGHGGRPRGLAAVPRTGRAEGSSTGKEGVWLAGNRDVWRGRNVVRGSGWNIIFYGLILRDLFVHS